MKRNLFLFLLFLIICSLLICCSGDDTGSTQKGDAQSDEYIAKTLEEYGLVDGATLSDIRPRENELSESEILVKVAKYAGSRYGVEGLEKEAEEIDPRLKDCKIETPMYMTLPDSSGNGYKIMAVDSNNDVVAVLSVRPQEENPINDFTGSIASYDKGTQFLTKRDVEKVLTEQFPDKIFSEPELMSLTLEGERFSDYQWYAAAVEKTKETESFSKALSANPNIEVEEYVVGAFVRGNTNSSSKSLQSLSENINLDWRGIEKLTEKTNFYKVFIANKSIVEPTTKSVKALDSSGLFAEYRGKQAKDIHNGSVSSVKIDIN